MRLSVMDFPSVQVAIDAAADGDTIYFPGLSPYAAPETETVTGWTISKSLTLCGDGPGDIGGGSGTILTTATSAGRVFTLTTGAVRVVIRDMQLRGPGGTGSGFGIYRNSPATGMLDIQIARVLVTDFPNHGISVTAGASGLSALPRFSLTDCTIRNCGGAGVHTVNVRQVFGAGCQFQSNKLNGLYAAARSLALYQCVFDDNCSAATGSDDGSLKCTDCDTVRVDACRFTKIDTGTIKRGCVVASSGLAILGPSYFEATNSLNTRGIDLIGAVGPVVVLPSYFKNVRKLIGVAGTVKDCFIGPQYSETTTLDAVPIDLPLGTGSMAVPHINKNGINVLSGMMLPSVSGDPTQAVRDGTLVYDTTGRLRLRVGGLWKTVVVQ